MKKTYDYCERCFKPIELTPKLQKYTYALCVDCASELMKKIFDDEEDSKDI